MSQTKPSRSQPVSLEELVAFNDEVVSLVRAGIPLELGFGGFRANMSRRFRRFTGRIEDRMRQGASLPEALADQEPGLPRVYRAVVEAGLKTGRLPEALESLTRFAQSLLDVRRRIALALIYPGIVMLVAYFLFWFFVSRLAGPLVETYRMFGLDDRFWVPVLTYLDRTSPQWGLVPPLLAALLVGWWLVSNRWLISGWGGWMLRWIPWMRQIVQHFHRATFAELLAMLVEQRVPLPEALRLAADSTGDRKTIEAADRLAGEVQSGKSLSESLQSEKAFPPFMRWMMSTGEQQGSLASALRQVMETYRRRALHQTEWFKLALPIVLTAGIGGGVVLIYGLTLFLPLTHLWKDLAI